MATDVVVVGGGIGGLATAYALTRKGLRVTVLEQASQFGEVGAGMQIAPNCTRILDSWGLLDEVTSLGVLPENIVMKDAVTGQALTPTPFHTSSRGFSPTLPINTPLPTLNLSRVFVITGSGTCSASESIINGLRGVGVQVIQIGNTTCGKPYGFYPQDNCGTTYFSIQFRGVNANNFGDYADGFVPSSSPSQQWQLPGCPVSDDFTQPLGSMAENRLEAALSYRATGGQCIALATESELAAAEAVVPKSPWKMNRILRD